MNDLLLGWILIGALLGGFIQCIFAIQYSDNISVCIAFWFVIYFYETYRDQLNRAGMIVAIAFIGVLTLPGSILILILFTLWKMIALLWKAFMVVFRKRN